MGSLDAILIIAAGYGLYMITQKNAASNLVLYPHGVNEFFFDNENNPTFVASVLVQNTSNSTFTINSLAGNAVSGTDKTIVGNVSSFQPITIGPNQEQDFPIQIRMSPLGIVNEIIDAFTNKNTTRVVTVDGHVNANGYTVPVSLTFSVGI